MAKVIFILACVAGFFAPFALTNRPSPDRGVGEVRSFPTVFEGRPLRDLGLSDRERGFLADFPGQIGRFADGNREIIIRRVTEATRKLHSAGDCFTAVGYTTRPLPAKMDDESRVWSCFTAEKPDDKLRVCERIEGTGGGEWTDVSAWYWSAFGQENGEWWAFTVAERWSDAPQF